MEAPVFQKIKKPVVGLITMLTFALAGLIGFASTASASEVEQAVPNVVGTIQSRTVAGKVSLAVRVQNLGSDAVNVNVDTPYGTIQSRTVPAGGNVYQLFATRQTSFDSASVQVVVDNVVFSVDRVSSDTSVDFTVVPRSLNDTPALAVRAHNTGTNAVDFDFETPFGSALRTDVVPGSSLYQSFIIRAS